MNIRSIIDTMETRWFMSSMATGALGILWVKMALFLHSPLMKTIGISLVFLAFLFFISATIGYVFRMVSTPHLVRDDFFHPSNSKFFPGISISLGVLSTATTTVLTNSFPLPEAGYAWLAGVLYILGLLFGLFFLVSICANIIVSKHTNIEHAIGTCLLPPVGVFVNIFSGNFFASKFLQATPWIYYMSLFHFFLFTLALILGAWALTFIIFRLRFHVLPKKEMAPSFFIPLAPIGVSIIALTSLIPILPVELPYAEILRSFAFLFIPIAISFGIFWAVVLLQILCHYLTTEGIPYTLGFWAMVFPVSAFGIGLFAAAKFLPGMQFFTWVGAFVGLIATFLWIVVIINTVLAIASGQAFIKPPCLED